MTPLSIDLYGETLEKFESLLSHSGTGNTSQLLRLFLDQCNADQIKPKPIHRKQFSFRLSPEQHVMLEGIARKHGISIGAAMRLIIEQTKVTVGTAKAAGKQDKLSTATNGSRRKNKTNPQRKDTMATKKKATKKAVKKAPAKKAAAKKAPAKKAVAKKAPAKKAVAKKAPAKKAVAKKAPAKKAVKKVAAKKAPAKKAVAKKAPAKKAAKKAVKKAPAKKAVAKKAPAKKAAKKKAK